jgi:hypothetical protein
MGCVNVHTKEDDPSTLVADLFLPRDLPLDEISRYVSDRIMAKIPGTEFRAVTAIQKATRHLLFPELVHPDDQVMAKRYIRLEVI